MQKLFKISLLLVSLFILPNEVFAYSVNCHFKSGSVSGVKSIELSEEVVILNGKFAIALEKTKIRCGTLGKRDRYEGVARGYQVILKDCGLDNKLAGHLIDSFSQEVADIECRQTF